MKIYIAGKITGLPLEECKQKFAAAEARLREIGANPVNPFKLGIPETASSLEALPHCAKAIRHCKAMFMLSDWELSFGARAEHRMAQQWKLDIFYEDRNDIDYIADLVKVSIVG